MNAPSLSSEHAQVLLHSRSTAEGRDCERRSCWISLALANHIGFLPDTWRCLVESCEGRRCSRQPCPTCANSWSSKCFPPWLTLASFGSTNIFLFCSCLESNLGLAKSGASDLRCGADDSFKCVFPFCFSWISVHGFWIYNNLWANDYVKFALDALTIKSTTWLACFLLISGQPQTLIMLSMCWILFRVFNSNWVLVYE